MTSKQQPENLTVTSIFNEVAPKYDLMNDLLSCGIHRIWKKFLIKKAGITTNAKILDIAGGTGVLSLRCAKKLAQFPNSRGFVTCADVNMQMLKIAKKRLALWNKNIILTQADACNMPCRDNSFDIITVGFGIRNIQDKGLFLTEMLRILKPGGKMLILEFSHPKSRILRLLYDLYSRYWIPLIAKIIVGNDKNYCYLTDSIKSHPDQEALRDIIKKAGFATCTYYNLTGGIVALHVGEKIA